MQQAGDGLAAVERYFHALDRVIRDFAAPIHHLVELGAEAELDGMVVVEDGMLRHAIRLDGVVVVSGRGGVGASLLGEHGQRFVPLRRFPPHLRQHAVVARALAGGHFQVIAFEVLHPPAHVQREVEHPLLIVALRPKPFHALPPISV